jgi:integrase
MGSHKNLLPRRCPDPEQAVMARVTLTERFIRSPARRPKAGRKDWPDAIVPGLALRVTEADHRSLVMIARYPLNPKNPTRRALGDLGEITLEQGRAKGRRWLELIARGIDPKVEEARQRAVEQRKLVNSFAVVATEYLTREATKLAHFVQARRIIEAEFVKRWGPRPATDILPEEAAAAIRAIVKRGAPAQARNAFGHGSRMFSWAIGTHEFGITVSPFASLRAAELVGKKTLRDRVLEDHELRAIWKAANGPSTADALADARRRDVKREPNLPLAYPYGPLVRLMILTGQREREVADMRWSEIDFSNKVWTILAGRMKGKRAHVIPLAPEALALLEALPRFAGDYVFSTTGGEKPVNGFSKTKERLDKLSNVSGWVLHDLRRTMRTHLSALPIEDRVREHMIAHAQPGLHQVYDRHSYSVEKRRGFELWEVRLRSIVEPTAAEITDLTAARARREITQATA